MLDVTVKTLDGKNTPFTVDDSMTVKNFKDHISGAIGIPADQQRIIFKGKVLQDDAKLADSDVAGKVVHVVLRPPPSTSSPAGSSSAAGTAAAAAAAPSGRRPAAASSQQPPRRAAQQPSGTSVMVASFSLPGDLTDTRQISSIVENVMRGIGPSGGMHVHSRSDPVTSVDVHIDLREAPHDSHAGPGFPGVAQGGRVAEQLAASQPGFIGGAEPRRCLQQIQGFVRELDQMIDDIEHLHVDRAADIASSGAANESAPRHSGSSRPAQPERPTAHDDGTGRVPVSSLTDALSQVAAVTSRLQPLIELYGSRARECAAAPVSRGADDGPQPAVPASDLAQARSESSRPGDSSSGSRPVEIRDCDRLLFDRTAEAMHTLGHILHNTSDLMVDWSRPPQEREVVVPPMLGMSALMLPRGPFLVPAGVTAQSAVFATPTTQSQGQPGSTARISGSSAGASQPGSEQPATSTAQPQAAAGISSAAGSSMGSGQHPPPPLQFLANDQMTGGVSDMFFVQLGLDHVPLNNSADQFGQVPTAAVITPSILNMPGVPPAIPLGASVTAPAGFMPFGFGLAPTAVTSAAGNVAAGQPSPAATAPPPPAGTAGMTSVTVPGLPTFVGGVQPHLSFVLPQQAQQLQDVLRQAAAGSLQPGAGQPAPGHPGQQPPAAHGNAAAAATSATGTSVGGGGSSSSSTHSVGVAASAAAQPPLPDAVAGLQQLLVLPPVVMGTAHPVHSVTMHVPLAVGVPATMPQLAHPPSQPHVARQPPASQQQETTSTRPAGSAASADTQQLAVQPNPAMNTAAQLLGGRHGSAIQADMYLPCNSIFWHPNVLPIVRQLNSAHLPPTSVGSATGATDSRSIPRSNLSTDTVRAQLRARETDSIAATQFHTMLSSIVNSVINRAMRPSGPGSTAAAGGTAPPEAPSSGGSTGAATAAGGGTRTSSTRSAEAGAAIGSSPAGSQSRSSAAAAPAAAGDASGLPPAAEQDVFDSAAFSSVLPAAIEQLAAFASFVAEPAAADSRPAAASSRGPSSNPLPDDLFMQLMAAVAQEVNPGYSTQRPPSTIQDFLQRMASSHGFLAESPTSATSGIIHNTFDIISRHLTFTDLQRLYDGDPNCLDRLRLPLSALIRSQVLDDGPTTDENVSAAVDRLVEEWGPHLASGLAGVETVSDIDLVGTVKQFARTHLKRLLRLILTPPGARSAPTVERSFGLQLDSLVRDSVFNLCQLLLHCLGNNVEALIRYVCSQVEALFGGASAIVVGMTSSLITAQVRSMISQLHVASASDGEDRVLPYLVKRTQPDQAAATNQSDHLRPISTSKALVQPSVEASRLVHGPEDDSSNYESTDESGHEMDIANTEPAGQHDSSATLIGTMHSEGSHAATPATADARLPGEPAESSNPMDAAAPTGDSSIKLESTRTPNMAASPADDWRSQVPQDWVPVIECDQRRQSEAAPSGGSGNTQQQPFSDAYLSGVPAKKRKVVTTKEESDPTSSGI